MWMLRYVNIFIILTCTESYISPQKSLHTDVFQKPFQIYPNYKTSNIYGTSQGKTQVSSWTEVNSQENVSPIQGVNGGCNFTTTHLVSLSSLTPTSPQSLRDIWKWKDLALGDGRDYFVPRPRAISDFQSLFLKNDHMLEGCKKDSASVEVYVEECAILSNCARLDVYLILRATSPPSEVFQRNSTISTFTMDWLEGKAINVTANVLANQLRSYQQTKSKRSFLSESISTFLDLPGVIQTQSQSSNAILGLDPTMNSIVEELTHSLTTVKGVENVTRHACLVAAGMKDRPSRPGREVPFRPFSSRDAHVMLQLKRTVEVNKH